jgi:hypothetical protein
MVLGRGVTSSLSDWPRVQIARAALFSWPIRLADHGKVARIFALTLLPIALSVPPHEVGQSDREQRK